MDEYAISLLKFFCGRAIRFPSIIERSESTTINKMIHNELPKLLIPTYRNLISPANAASFAIVVIRAVIIVGDPSYVSGAQKWKGAAAILNPKPTSAIMTPVIRR